jgi:hypothetical protein
MGTPGEKGFSQWSRGEYPRANRQEDDVGIIASVLGYVTDEAGGNVANSKPLKTKGRDVRQKGVISHGADADVYSFQSLGGDLRVQANPAAVGRNLLVELELLDASGQKLATSISPIGLGASISQEVGAGLHFLRVRGAGFADQENPGFSRYGSLGAYTLSGMVPVDVPMEFTSPDTIAGKVGDTLSYRVSATDLFEHAFVVEPSPSELEINDDQRSFGKYSYIDFRATEPGRYEVTIGVKRRSEVFSKVIEVIVAPRTKDLAAALHPTFFSIIQPTTTEAAPWSIDNDVKVDTYASVRSGTVGDGECSTISTSVAGPGWLRFRWRVDSEPGIGVLSFRIDGVEQARISGHVEWEERSFPLSWATHALEWVYEKTGGEVAGADAGWVDRVSLSRQDRPLIVSPLFATGIQGKPFEYRIEAREGPHDFFATGLPADLELDATTGLITGIPQTAGTFSISLQAQNTHSIEGQTLELRILGDDAPLGDVLDAPALAWISAIGASNRFD